MNKSHITKAVKYSLHSIGVHTLASCSITGYPVNFRIEESYHSKHTHVEDGVYYLFTVLMMLKNTKSPYKVFAMCKGISVEIIKLVEPYANKETLDEVA